MFTAEEFDELGPVVLTLCDRPVGHLMPRRFKTGASGWHTSVKTVLGKHRVQVNCVAVIIGSGKPTGEQTSITPEKAPGAPPERSALFGDHEPYGAAKEPLEGQPRPAKAIPKKGRKAKKVPPQ